PGSRRDLGDRGFKTITNIAGLGNMYLAMATGWNNVAKNGTGRNGVYTDALLRYLKPGETLETVFQRASVLVKQHTQYAQNPQLLTEYATDNKMTF
ncbi:caspase family protein, partial [Larkinella rosea]